MSNYDNSYSVITERRRNRALAGFRAHNRYPAQCFSAQYSSSETHLNSILGHLPLYYINNDGCSVSYDPCSCSEDIVTIPPLYLRSKNNITSGGFQVGNEPEKDMYNGSYTDEFDPATNSDIFPGIPPIIEDNIVAGDKEDKTLASVWDDLGNDVFDDWGYFYIYDVTSEKYYFPIIEPQNQDDGIFTTQTFSAFDRTFTITHGWAVTGIFKFDITVDDDLPFRFGAYGNMGSDGDQVTEDLTHTYTINGADITLYYRKDAEDGDPSEILYTYFIPRKVTENSSQPYSVYYDSDDYMSMFTNEITTGITIYYAKSNDVKEWVANDIEGYS